MGTDLVRATPIMTHIKKGEVQSDLALEDFAKEKERWGSGGTAGDQAVVTALTALEEGRVLIDLNTVLEQAGTSRNSGNGSYLPALTYCPSTAKEVSIRIWHDGEMRIQAKVGKGLHRNWSTKVFSGIRFPRADAISYSALAVVPAMPPEVRKIAKKEHVILWEAEWRKVGSQVQRPPRDPALLERVSGSLYVVLAAWDLSPLEIAALS